MKLTVVAWQRRQIVRLSIRSNTLLSVVAGAVSGTSVLALARAVIAAVVPWATWQATQERLMVVPAPAAAVPSIEARISPELWRNM